MLTCAHVLPEEGSVTVTVTNSSANGGKPRTYVAEVLRRDDDRDIALLKVPTQADLATVLLAPTTAVEAGETVTVIDHPGAGEAVLSQTLTTGVVSSRARKLDGRTYVQTSAAVNLGSSGGPMFDSHGDVIGLVVLKARIEGAAFAVPAAELRDFPQKATVNLK
ncbi:MAG: trypsin-like peptidase domain-containing protein [Planctomycetaceae bacterium]|nr:trypsin-like peptidase domain-containing protein [Planctomycetaceae bacterium]